MRNRISRHSLEDADFNAFRASLKSMLREVCDIAQMFPVPMKRWIHVDIQSDGSWKSGPVDSPDFPSAEVFQVIPSLTSLNAIDEAIRANAYLADRFLKDINELAGVAGDPNWWLSRQFISPIVLTYFERVQGVHYDEAAVDAVIDEVMKDVLKNTITVHSVTPLHNLTLSTDVIDLEDGLRLRKISLEDIERWMNPQMVPIADFRQRWDLMDLHTVVEETVEIPFETGFDAPSQRVKDVVSIVGLVTKNGDILPAWSDAEFRRSYGAIMTKGPAFPFVSPYSGRGSTTVLDESLIEKVTKAWGHFQSDAIRMRLGLALRRWYSAQARNDNQDRLIDYWIALESLFGAGTETEAAFKMSLRIAALLEGPVKERQAIFHAMRHSYDWRSKLVHGNQKEISDLEKKRPLKNVVEQTHRLLNQALLKFLEGSNRSNLNPVELVDLLFVVEDDPPLQPPQP